MADGIILCGAHQQEWLQYSKNYQLPQLTQDDFVKLKQDRMLLKDVTRLIGLCQESLTQRFRKGKLTLISLPHKQRLGQWHAPYYFVPADTFTKLLRSKHDTFTIAELAKGLGIPRPKLYAWFRNNADVLEPEGIIRPIGFHQQHNLSCHQRTRLVSLIKRMYGDRTAIIREKVKLRAKRGELTLCEIERQTGLGVRYLYQLIAEHYLHTRRHRHCHYITTKQLVHDFKYLLSLRLSPRRRKEIIAALNKREVLRST